MPGVALLAFIFTSCLFKVIFSNQQIHFCINCYCILRDFLFIFKDCLVIAI